MEVTEEMLAKVNTDSYKKNGKFYEKLFIQDLAKDLVVISKEATQQNNGIYVRPDATVTEL